MQGGDDARLGTRICVVSEIEGSRSIARTEPLRAAAAASENVVVVFPTPPLLLATAMMSVMELERHGLKPWIEAARKRLHHNVLAIALANKLARIAWSVLARGRAFEVRKVDEVAAQPI